MQLTEWGKRIETRLSELGKDWKWICHAMSLKGYRYSWNELMRLVSEENLSMGRKNAIEKLLREEERRQEFRKQVGFRNLGKSHRKRDREQ